MKDQENEKMKSGLNEMTKALSKYQNGQFFGIQTSPKKQTTQTMLKYQPLLDLESGRIT